MTNKICTSQMSNIDFPIMLERVDVGTGETHTVPYNLFLRLDNKAKSSKTLKRKQTNVLNKRQNDCSDTSIY